MGWAAPPARKLNRELQLAACLNFPSQFLPPAVSAWFGDVISVTICSFPWMPHLRGCPALSQALPIGKPSLGTSSVSSCWMLGAPDWMVLCCLSTCL